MKRFLLLFFSVGLSFCALTTAAQAQATRTWVSGVGDDANPCSRTAPCKTFAGAVSRTADCGEIDALDPAGYGTVTLTKGLKIDGGGGEGGQVASILAGPGVPGVTVNNSSVGCPFDVLRNLDINGVNVGTNGVNIAAGGTLALENVDIENFTGACVNIAQVAAVGFNAYNTNMEKCNAGGLVINYTGAGTERAVLSGTHMSKNAGIGLSVTGNAKVSARDCDLNQNGGGGVQVSGANAFVDLQHCQISNNQGFGVHATASGTITLADNTVAYNNGTGLLADPGSSIVTWSNNWVTNNSPDGARTGTIVPF